MGNASARQFAVEIARIALENKAELVTAMDLQGISPLCDYAIICTGQSDRQMKAIADMAVQYGRKIGEKPYGVSGYGEETWTIVDFVDVVLHIFSRAYREYYDLELLWGDAPRLEIQRSETA